MAKSFVYDSVATVDATTIDGTRGVPDDVTFAASASITNEHYFNDNSIANAVTSFDDDDVIQFDFGASVDAEFVAIHTTTQETNDVLIHVASSATAMGAAKVTQSDTFEVGWTIIDLGGTESGRYWYIVSDGGFTGMTEIIIGAKYVFDANPSLGNTLGENYRIDVVETYGGIEHSNKRHDGKTVWNWVWEFISASTKTSLETLRDAVDGDRLKFIYDDETTKNWVRMSADSLVFTETTYQAFSAPISLREQLS